MKNTFKVDYCGIKERLHTLSTFIDESKPGYTRRPFTKPNVQSRKWLIKEMEKLGLTVEIDATSNIIGTLKGEDKTLSPMMIGSHTDSVVGGGMFDGPIGVIAGLEIVSYLKNNNIKLLHTLKIVDFTGEEASEFGISTIGSRGMVGVLTEKDLNRKDDNGRSLKEGIKSVGGRPENITQEAIQEKDISLFLELHIEQGPTLEQFDRKLGIVTGFVGIQRYRIEVEGQPNHAGTTPMNYRKDALTTSAEIVLGIEEICNNDYETPLVGTVGRLNVEPNGPNIIPGKVVFDFELRSMDDGALDQAFQKIEQHISVVGEKRNILIHCERISKVSPISVEPEIIEGIEKSVKELGKTLRLHSGAGHDGVQISKVAPIGMIFIPSKDGKSHCPEEWSDYEDVALGIEAMLESTLYFDMNIEGLARRKDNESSKG